MEELIDKYLITLTGCNILSRKHTKTPKPLSDSRGEFTSGAQLATFPKPGRGFFSRRAINWMYSARPKSRKNAAVDKNSSDK
jgi:hypothetical protein